jgi:hypothetical protein
MLVVMTFPHKPTSEFYGDSAVSTCDDGYDDIFNPWA